MKINRFHIDITTEWINDPHGDNSHLGDFSRSYSSGWHIDCHEGLLYHNNKAIRPVQKHFDKWYRYWIPSENHLPHNPNNWVHVDEASVRATIEKYGSIENADIEYAIQDYNRAVDFMTGEWNYVGCVVTVYMNGDKIAKESLWGIESDSGPEYKEEIESELTNDALSQLKGEAKNAIK